MQKITKEQFDQLKLARTSIGKEIITALEILEIDEGFIITRDEWKMKQRPADFFPGYASQNNIKLTTRALEDGTGWAILRTE